MQASVSEYTSMIRPPVSCSNRRLVSARSGADPETHSLIDEKSTLPARTADRKSTRLNSSHLVISYAVFCLKKKKKDSYHTRPSSSVIYQLPSSATRLVCHFYHLVRTTSTSFFFFFF